jgi:hypothetical protein
MSRLPGRSPLRWSSLRSSSLLALGALVAWDARPPRDAAQAAQPRLTCASQLLATRHSDRLSTLLARRDSRGILSVTGPATLVPFRGLERLREGDFAAEQAVAVLDLTADQGALPRGRYCMTAQLAGSDPNALASWTVRYYAVVQGSAATTPTQSTRGLAYREVDTAADAADGPPRPAARFHFVRRRPGGPASGTGGDGGLFHHVALARGTAQDPLEFYSAWYRCGNGCCGADLSF